MTTTTARCDRIIALIDRGLAEYESSAPLRLVHGALRPAAAGRNRDRRTALRPEGAGAVNGSPFRLA